MTSIDRNTAEKIAGHASCQTMPSPTFTVVVPTHRRLTALSRCLSSLSEQRFPKSEYEIIVVDDAGMPEAVAPIVERVNDVSCRLLTQSHRGAAAARNLGASIAHGRILAFTDDDCRPAPDWLESLGHRMAEDRGSVIVGGRVINELEDDPYAGATQALVDFLYGYYNRDHQRARMLTSNNLCIPTEAFRDIGGFDSSFTGAGGEDRELCLRWANAGYRLVYAPEALVLHAHAMSLPRFFGQHYAYGRGAALLRRRALHHGYGPIQFEPTSFYLELLRYPIDAREVDRRTTTAALFALSQLANGLGFVRVRLEELVATCRRIGASGLPQSCGTCPIPTSSAGRYSPGQSDRAPAHRAGDADGSSSERANQTAPRAIQ
jgi:GT2 family glycosyltransferase